VAWRYDEYKELRQSCVDDGLLTKAFGRGNLRITKKGREVVKRMAVLDEEVAAALQEASVRRYSKGGRRSSRSC
jgi:hypothetical protein